MNTLLSFGKRPAAAAPLLALLFFTASCSRFNASGGLSIWGYVLLALDVLAFLDIFRQPWDIGKKLLWAAIVFFFPFGGLLGSPTNVRLPEAAVTGYGVVSASRGLVSQ